MHLKKTKKTPRMIRIIALMLSLVLAFFTMTGMAIAEEGTDVTDTAPDSTPEIVEAELELEPEPTEELPAEAPGTEIVGTHAGAGRTLYPTGTHGYACAGARL